MDVKIKDGDIVLDSTGNPDCVYDSQEVLQRVIMCITAEKGGYIYNKDLGLQAVTEVSGERECKRLETLIREAVTDVEGACVYLDSAQELIDGRILAGITVTYKEDIMTAEVII